MTKKAIREAEENLPTITESIMKMNPTAKLLHLMPYNQVRKNLILNTHRNLTLLDIGCGDGLFLRKVIDAFIKSRNNFTYVGMDISIRKITAAKRIAQRFNSLKTHFVLADAEHLPFKVSVFNVATIIEVIEHLIDPRALITELDRVIKINGTLIITTPSAHGTKGNLLNVFKRYFFLKRSVGNREKYILIQGKKLPHRDFTLNELTTILSPHFVCVKIYSFNFRAIYYVLARGLPHRIIALIISYFENNAPKLPKVWGNNWLLYAKKNYEYVDL
jgi:ubiquinone/menaquinone biosynthesis C-methylase UbiE